MANWLRAYQFSAGQAGAAGFAITQLHINFSVGKSGRFIPKHRENCPLEPQSGAQGGVGRKGLHRYFKRRI